MPTEPIVLTVLKALTDSLEQITVANGFFTDLTGAVFRGRTQFSESEDPLPFVSINTPPTMPDETDSPIGSSARNGEHSLLVQGFCQDDIRNPTDPAYLLLDDVERRLEYERTRDEGYNVLGFGSRVVLEYGQGVVRSPDSIVSDTAYFWLPVTLKVPRVVLA